MQRLRLERRPGGAPHAYVEVAYPVRLHGFSPLALRSDIARFLNDCPTRLESIRCVRTKLQRPESCMCYSTWW